MSLCRHLTRSLRAVQCLVIQTMSLRHLPASGYELWDLHQQNGWILHLVLPHQGLPHPCRYLWDTDPKTSVSRPGMLRHNHVGRFGVHRPQQHWDILMWSQALIAQRISWCGGDQAKSSQRTSNPLRLETMLAVDRIIFSKKMHSFSDGVWSKCFLPRHVCIRVATHTCLSLVHVASSSSVLVTLFERCAEFWRPVRMFELLLYSRSCHVRTRTFYWVFTLLLGACCSQFRAMSLSAYDTKSTCLRVDWTALVNSYIRNPSLERANRSSHSERQNMAHYVKPIRFSSHLSTPRSVFLVFCTSNERYNKQRTPWDHLIRHSTKTKEIGPLDS